MDCPYLRNEGNGIYYCELKDDYINKDRYSSYCYNGWGWPEYVHCPTYEREQKERERNGRPRLKRHDD